MRHFRLHVLFLLLACTLLQNAATLNASDQFLDTCLKIVEAREKRLVVAREQLNLAKIRIARSARNFFPGLAVERKISRGRTITDEYQSEELGLRASQPIYEGGRLSASYRYECLMENAARYNYTKVREEVFYKIKLAYYELLSLRIEYNALKKAFAEIDKLQEKVKLEYDAKAISELDMIESRNFRDKVENLYRESELSLDLANKKLVTLIGVASLDSIPVLIPEGLSDDVPEISFTLKECLGFVNTNNIDLKLNQTQIRLAEQKNIVNRSKVIPKLDFNGYYGRSGEAFVTEPLQLATVWSIMGKISWSLWGNSFELMRTDEKSTPTDIVDAATRLDVQSYEARLYVLDDMNYFVDSKEGKIGYQQAEVDYRDTYNKNVIDFQKSYNEYANSLMNARTLKNEITLHVRKLELMRKRNDLYEVPTVNVMEEAWKHAEAVSSYSKALYYNYAAVTDMERIALIPLR
jgi:outer membrane protein TolC